MDLLSMKFCHVFIIFVGQIFFQQVFELYFYLILLSWTRSSVWHLFFSGFFESTSAWFKGEHRGMGPLFFPSSLPCFGLSSFDILLESALAKTEVEHLLLVILWAKDDPLNQDMNHQIFCEAQPRLRCQNFNLYCLNLNLKV